MFFRFLHTAILLTIFSSVASCNQSDAPVTQLQQPLKVEQGASWQQAFQGVNKYFTLAKGFTQQKSDFDFNADGKNDYIYYVNLKSSADKLTDILLVQPWPKMGEQKSGAKNAILIVHGGKTLPALIHDSNDISLLDTSAMLQSTVIPKADIASLAEPALTNSAKGDIILMPTEAGIDAFIYWDGSKYQLYEIIEMP